MQNMIVGFLVFYPLTGRTFHGVGNIRGQYRNNDTVTGENLDYFILEQNNEQGRKFVHVPCYSVMHFDQYQNWKNEQAAIEGKDTN